MTWVRILLVLSNLLSFSRAQSQLIYKVVSMGRDTTTYLIGTYNILPREQFQYTPLLDSILDEVELVFTESFHQDRGLRPLVHAKERIRMMSYPNKQRLEDVIGRKETARVYAYYRSKFGIRKRVFKQFSYYIPVIMDQQIRYGSDQYIKPDRYILHQVEKKRKTIYNLDQPALTQGAFEALARLYPPDWLVQLTRNDSAYVQEIVQRKDCYITQDTACLKASLREKINRHPVEYFQLLNRRTQYWKDEIERTIKTRNLILVGIDQLLEEKDGLLEYYREKGHTIIIL